MKICIVLHGCDDTTYIKDIEVTKEQLKLLEDIAERSKEVSTYGCMPIMSIDRDNKGRIW